MSVFKRGKFWWYEFWFAGRRIQESTHATSKTIAKLAEQKRRRELEEGFNNVEDQRKEQIRSLSDIAKEFLASYQLRNRSYKFARYAIGRVTRILGDRMIVDISDVAVREYQDARLKEKALPSEKVERLGIPRSPNTLFLVQIMIVKQHAWGRRRKLTNPFRGATDGASTLTFPGTSIRTLADNRRSGRMAVNAK